MNRYLLPLSVLGTVAGGAVLLRDYVAGGSCPSKANILGKTVIVTGANTGIGKQTALELARRGGNIILACRDMEKCEAAAKDIRRETLNHHVNARHLDLASLKSIREFAAKIIEEEERVHILVNNAAVMRCPHWTTEDGFEMQFGVNHLGHFLLTNLLLDKLKASAPSRIINLSSLAHVAGHIDFEDLNWERREYDTKAAYCQSKLAVALLPGAGADAAEPSAFFPAPPAPPSRPPVPGLALLSRGRDARKNDPTSASAGLTLESALCTCFSESIVDQPRPLSRELTPRVGGLSLPGGSERGVCSPPCPSLPSPSGTGVTVNALHPGVARTELGRHTGMHSSAFSSFTLGPIFWLLVKSPQLAAQTSTYLAVAEELEGVSGKYFDGLKEKAPAPEAEDEEVAQRLWAESARLVGLEMSRGSSVRGQPLDE
ncbi:retinol dehydrogenase 13 [Crocuta crocuta]